MKDGWSEVEVPDGSRRQVRVQHPNGRPPSPQDLRQVGNMLQIAEDNRRRLDCPHRGLRWQGGETIFCRRCGEAFTPGSWVWWWLYFLRLLRLG